jgi:KamA family protein
MEDVGYKQWSKTMVHVDRGDSAQPVYRPHTRSTIHKIPQWKILTREQKEAISLISLVLPFRVNSYVADCLIDWDNIPDDPIFQLTFPQPGMLRPDELEQLRALADRGEPELAHLIRRIRGRMNPHPAGQLTHNVPTLDGKPIAGVQHKYRETVLFFPSAGQTCHAYCTFCFRWPQFVGMDELKFNARSTLQLVAYLRQHHEVTDVLITGGDPLVMNTRSLASYIEPLLSPDLGHVQTIRIGTKALSYWPHRFVTDRDADDLLRLFERVRAAGRNVALMAHFNHPNELEPEIAQKALRRIADTGTVTRMQAPVIRHINENADDWARLWTLGVRLGAVPYYMFVERDTGPNDYFRLPLARAYEIFQAAYRQLSGLARTVRGPCMSAFPGKVLIDGIVRINGEQYFALQFLQARDPANVRRPFFAKFDRRAHWLDDLTPAFDSERFFLDAKPGEVHHVAAE